VNPKLPRPLLFLAGAAIAVVLAIGPLGVLGLHARASAPGSAPDQPAAAPAALAQPRTIGLDEFRKLVATRQAVILDARPEGEFSGGHVPHAVNLPRYRAKKSIAALETSLGLTKDQPVVVYCCSKLCTDSGMLAQILVQRGYSHVLLFKGGMVDWQTHGLPQEM